MSLEDKPVTIAQIPPEDDPTIVRQTGMEDIDITVLKLCSHFKAHITSGSVTFGTDQVKVSGMPGYLDYTDLILASPTKHMKYNDGDADVDLHTFCMEMASQGTTWIYGCSKFSPPDMSASTAMLKQFYNDMYNALTKQPIAILDHEGQVAATLAKLMEGLQWRDEDVGTNEEHCQWYRRFVILLGSAWAPTFPKYNEKFESMNDLQMIRTVYTYLCVATWVIGDFIGALAAHQSERAVFNMAFMVKNLVNPKVPNIGGAMDKEWAIFCDNNKFVESVPSGHTCYTGNFPNVSKIATAIATVTTSDDALKMFGVTYHACEQALVWARQLFGVGRYNTREESTNFAALFDLNHGHKRLGALGAYVHSLVELDSGHGLSTWYLGANLAIGLNYLEDYTNFRFKIFEIALQNRKHWSYDDISAWSKTIFVDYSFTSSIMGIIEDTCYKGLRTQVGFSAYAVPLVSSYFTDPNKLVVSGNNLAAPATAANGYEQPYARGLYPFLFSSALCSRLYKLQYLGEWTEAEMLMDQRYSLLLSRKYNSSKLGAADFHRIWASRIRAIQLIGGYPEQKKEKATICYMTSDAAEPRFESYADVKPYVSTSDSTNIKYGSNVVSITPALKIVISAPRLTGMGHTTIVSNLTGFDKSNAWMTKIVRPVTVKVIKDSPKDTVKPDTPKDEDLTPKK